MSNFNRIAFWHTNTLGDNKTWQNIYIKGY